MNSVLSFLFREGYIFSYSHTYDNGSLFIRPFREYFKPIHAGLFVCQAENAAGSIQTLPIQVKPRKNTKKLYHTYTNLSSCFML